MGVLFAPYGVRVSVEVTSSEPQPFLRDVRQRLHADGYEVMETSEDLQCFEKRSGFNDVSVGPIKLNPAPSDVSVRVFGSTIVLTGPCGELERLTDVQ